MAKPQSVEHVRGQIVDFPRPELVYSHGSFAESSARAGYQGHPQKIDFDERVEGEDLDEHDPAPNEESQESFASIDAELQQEQESYSALRTLWGVDAVENDDIGLVTDLKSGSEMKIQGEARMFWDEVGYLLEGLESTILGVQRTR